MVVDARTHPKSPENGHVLSNDEGVEYLPSRDSRTGGETFVNGYE